MQVTPALETGGVEQVTLDLAAAVAHAGRRSIVASRGGRLEGALAASGAMLARLPVHSRNPFTVAANAAALAKLVRRERVSLIHVRSRAPAFSALSAAKATNVPLVATYHGVYSAGSSLKRWYNAVMTRGDLVIANSSFVRDHIVAEHCLDPARVVVAPEGIDTERFDPAAVAPARIAAVRASWGLAANEPGPVNVFLPRLPKVPVGGRLNAEVLKISRCNAIEVWIPSTRNSARARFIVAIASARVG